MYCRFPKIAPKVRKLFLNMSFTLGEEPPLTVGEELQTARYRLYRSQILQQNMRWKALAEIYTMHSFAPVWNPLTKIGEKRAWPKQPRKGRKRENARPLSSAQQAT